jgi:hypothetical protein
MQLRSLLSNMWRRMIRNICYRASNPSMHCAWLGASFEVCNTVIPPVVSRNASLLCRYEHPAPPPDHWTTSTSGNRPRPSFLPMFSRLGPPPRESPLPHSPNVGRSAGALLARVTRLRHPRPLTHTSRRSFPLHRRHAHLRVTDRLHHFHPPRVRIAFLFRPSTTDETIPRECHIDEDAVLDDTFLSSEKVVLGIMKSYVQCKS